MVTLAGDIDKSLSESIVDQSMSKPYHVGFLFHTLYKNFPSHSKNPDL